MASDGSMCPNCGASVPAEAFLCPSCHTPVSEEDWKAPEEAVPAHEADVADEPEVAPRSSTEAARDPPAREAPTATRIRVPVGRRTAPAGPFAVELTRRLSRLSQWAESVEALGVEIPRLPGWAEEAARNAPNPEPWAEVVRGVERIAQRRIVAAFEEWAKKTKGRLGRLDAYAVDSRLERDQIEDALHTARTGDIAQALATYRQVDRVVTIKERHLDQAREELERVVSLLKDMHALGVDPPQDPAETADELEAELRAGKLAPLKQQIRALRLQAVGRLKTSLPRYISEYGDYLVDERAHGIATEREAIELARGARDFFRGRPEEGLRRLRALQETHGLPPGRASRPTSRAART
jgi:RNA polymerase subunit RPABC4/transcription elongation factor Spt4